MHTGNGVANTGSRHSGSRSIYITFFNAITPFWLISLSLIPTIWISKIICFTSTIYKLLIRSLLILELNFIWL